MTDRTMTKPLFSKGSKWALFTKEELSYSPTDPYLTRYRLIQTPWFGIFVHVIHRADREKHAWHDHPWPFVSILLRGGYTEGRPSPFRNIISFPKHRKAPSIAYRPRNSFHHIVELDRTPTITLMLVGKRQGNWGFLTEDGNWHPHEVWFKTRESS